MLILFTIKLKGKAACSNSIIIYSANVLSP